MKTAKVTVYYTSQNGLDSRKQTYEINYEDEGLTQGEAYGNLHAGVDDLLAALSGISDCTLTAKLHIDHPTVIIASGTQIPRVEAVMSVSLVDETGYSNKVTDRRVFGVKDALVSGDSGLIPVTNPAILDFQALLSDNFTDSEGTHPRIPISDDQQGVNILSVYRK